MTDKLRFTPVIAVVAALAVAGCGSQASTPKSKLIARADAICKPINSRRQTANAEVGAITSSVLPKVARIAPALASDERKALAELRALTAPASLAGSWQRILTGAQQLADNTGRLGVYAKAGDLKGVEGLIHTDQQKERELITIATATGFKHCGRNA